MGILNGYISDAVIHQTVAPFGYQLQEEICFPLSQCADVALEEDGIHAWVIGEDRLVCFEMLPGMPIRKEGELSGLGACRQLALLDGYAYITARQDGFFIVDISQSSTPRLVQHIDSLELATGICAANSLCLVTNRHMGVEIWDVSNPEQPVFCSLFYAGEAQSVCIDGNYAYVGDWMNKRVFIEDISDPYHPHTVSAFFVDGYADGLFVRNGLCLVTTGHHSARLMNRRKFQTYPYMTAEMIQEGYGCGHGLTLFDVSLPDSPEFLSCVKMPPFYGGVDTWRVTASGNFAYVADTHNGIFVVNIQDLLKPFIYAYYQMPLVHQKQKDSPPLQTMRACAMGIASASGRLLVAGNESGFHVLTFEKATPCIPCAKRNIATPTAVYQKLFSCRGQIHNFIEYQGFILLACGDDGLYALRPTQPEKPIFHIMTCGIAYDIVQMNDFLFVSEGNQGLSSWRFDQEKGFTPLGRWSQPHQCIRQAVAVPEKNELLLQMDVIHIGFLRVDESGQMRLLEKIYGDGMLYHRHLCRTVHTSSLALALPLSCGELWIDPNRQCLADEQWKPTEQACPFEDGAAIDGERIWVIRSRKCGYYTDPADTLSVVQGDTLQSIPGAELRGMPFVVGKTLVILHRIYGIVERIDISNPNTPTFMDRTRISAHPEFAMEIDGKCWLACGHDGLIALS